MQRVDAQNEMVDASPPEELLDQPVVTARPEVLVVETQPTEDCSLSWAAR